MLEMLLERKQQSLQKVTMAKSYSEIVMKFLSMRMWTIVQVCLLSQFSYLFAHNNDSVMMDYEVSVLLIENNASDSINGLKYELINGDVVAVCGRIDRMIESVISIMSRNGESVPSVEFQPHAWSPVANYLYQDGGLLYDQYADIARSTIDGLKMTKRLIQNGRFDGDSIDQMYDLAFFYYASVVNRELWFLKPELYFSPSEWTFIMPELSVAAVFSGDKHWPLFENRYFYGYDQETTYGWCYALSASRVVNLKERIQNLQIYSHSESGHVLDFLLLLEYAVSKKCQLMLIDEQT